MKNFAIVGCGRIAKRHAENISRVGKLVAVCDAAADKAKVLADEYGASAYNSLDAMLQHHNTIDIVSVCSPNGFHAEHIIKSLQAGKDVLTEKPLCLTTAAAWQIIETEKFCRKKLFVVKSARYNPIIRQLKAMIDAGTLGKLYSFHLNCIWNRGDSYYTDWKGKKFPDGGTLYNQFSHFVDVMLWLFGEVRSVKAFAANLGHQNSIEFEDTGAAAMQMNNGMIGSLHWSVNAFQKNVEISLTVLTEKGSLKIGGENLNHVEYQLTDPAISFPAYEKEHWGNHGEIYNHLMSALDAGERFPDAYDGLRAVETIEKIYKATVSA